MTTFITLGLRIEQLRKDRGWSQSKLGKIAGLSTSSVSHFETEQREPSFRQVVHIACAFGMTLTEFLRDVDLSEYGQ